MYTKLNYEGFENYLLKKKPKFDGWRYVFKFDNQYGASVIKHCYSYGSEENLWELAVLVFPNKLSDGFYITYDTPITSDVEGYLSDEEVRNLLEKIKELQHK